MAPSLSVMCVKYTDHAEGLFKVKMYQNIFFNTSCSYNLVLKLLDHIRGQRQKKGWNEIRILFKVCNGNLKENIFFTFY
jgi:hypothetical protein